MNGVHVVLKDYKERRTTDCLFMLVLIAAWVAMTIIGITSGKNGDPKLLIAPYSDDVSQKSCDPLFLPGLLNTKLLSHLNIFIFFHFCLFHYFLFFKI